MSPFITVEVFSVMVEMRLYASFEFNENQNIWKLGFIGRKYPPDFITEVYCGNV